MKNILLLPILFGIFIVSGCGPNQEELIFTSLAAFRADSLEKDSIQKAEVQNQKEKLL